MASGRAADVYECGDHAVLRRYRSDHDTGREARIMQWLSGAGFPVPLIHEVDGRDLLMERIDGVTMLDDLDEHPWKMIAHARDLANLQRRLNDLAAPDWMDARAGVPDGRDVVHLDLHPMNVILGPEGPVVIDWTNAGRGNGGFDAALSFVVMGSFEVEGMLDRAGLRTFVTAFELARGRALVRPWIADACRHRLRDPNVTAGERRHLETRLASAGQSGDNRPVAGRS